MWEYLRQRIREAVAAVQSVTLATCGPAGAQASRVPAEAVGTNLYLLLLSTSDHWLNLEHHPEVVLVGNGWELRGVARFVPAGETPHLPRLLEGRAAGWGVLLEVLPVRFHVQAGDGWGYAETIDLPPQ
jgi:hypothetical protein